MCCMHICCFGYALKANLFIYMKETARLRDRDRVKKAPNIPSISSKRAEFTVAAVHSAHIDH